jgi:hypothetical protein
MTKFEKFSNQYSFQLLESKSASYRENDRKRLKFIRKLLTRYKNNSDNLNCRLIMNHIIVFKNVFGNKYSVDTLWNEIDPVHRSTLKTFMLALRMIDYDFAPEVELDYYVINRLRIENQ